MVITASKTDIFRASDNGKSPKKEKPTNNSESKQAYKNSWNKKLAYLNKGNDQIRNAFEIAVFLVSK